MATQLWGGLSGRQMAAILGVSEAKTKQAAEPALDRAAIIAMKNLPAFLRMLADRMDTPTPGMLDILARRDRMLESIRSSRQPESAAV